MRPLGCVVTVSQRSVVATWLMAFLPLGAEVARVGFSGVVFRVTFSRSFKPLPLGAIEMGAGVFWLTRCVSTRLVGFVRVVARGLLVFLWDWVSVIRAVPAAALKEIPSVGGVLIVMPLGAVRIPGGSLVIRVRGGTILCLPLGAGLFAVVAKKKIFFALTC